jgi:type VI secretion system protein ImpK
MTSLSAAGHPESEAQQLERRGFLALAFQDALTATVRLRAGRQAAADASSFRSHLKRLLNQADQEARAAGYPGQYAKLAMFAVIAFIDESVLGSGQPTFADWPRQPLQEEVFGEHMGGEVFFDNLRRLMGSQDSEELADVLEVYLLCLLLGFQGRYSRESGGELGSLTSALSDKIVRIRGASGELSPRWSIPHDEVAPESRDPWINRLGLAALLLFALAAVMWIIFRLALGSGANDLQSLVG